MLSDDPDRYRLDHYDYELPEDLIAHFPSRRRDDSRLLVLDRSRSDLEHRKFGNIGDYLRPGDVLVVNDTRVVPARLRGIKESGGKVEILVLDPVKEPEAAEREGYLCLIKASKPPRPGSRIRLNEALSLVVSGPVLDGKGHVRFETDEPLLDVLDRMGETPLPPYVQSEARPHDLDDRSAYQTVYASSPGAVAAPTAGLHFTADLLESLSARGIERVAVTLHVGYGTFSPIRTEDVRRHRMHSEHIELSREAAHRIQSALDSGRRIVAVGTTVVRTLEWVFKRFGAVAPFQGPCNHYIYPGYDFKVVTSLITNFHLPRSSLLLLVCALAGRERILAAYREAVRRRYRFFSYGDAMLIL